MTVHLRKLAVGVNSVDDFRSRIAARAHAHELTDDAPVFRHLTRHMPARSSELLDGGSLYWVIGGLMLVRTRLLALETVTSEDGKRCALVLEAKLVRTEPRPQRPFQGWRYLEAADAPPDVNCHGEDELPPSLAHELRALGLI